VSNRRRAKPIPPPAVATYARSYRCTDCDSRTGRAWRDNHSLWHFTVEHDDTCPVLNGRVSGTAAGLAAAAAAAVTGERVLYAEVASQRKESA
jgi:hypothetical protein